MRALHRKLLRDLWHMKSQSVAICLVIACGVATCVMSVSTALSLVSAKTRFYEENRFAGIFVHLKRAPLSLAARIAEIPGVARVQPRIVAEVTLDIPGMAEPARGRLVSLSRRPETELNSVHLQRGRMPEPGRRGEVLVSEAFAGAHHFRAGDGFTAIINGRLQQLTITGTALSPEFIYQIRPGELLPDEKRYGTIWMPEPELAAACDLEGAFNDATLTLQRGAAEEAVIKALDSLTAPYGGQGACTREDQVSNRFVTDELTELRAMATIPPAIFLLVAAFLLNMVIARLVNTQREQIAALKAFGYTSMEVARHYLAFAALITLAGIIAGTGTGVWMGHSLTRMYVKFFRFPHFEYELHPAIIPGAAVLALLAAAAGVFTSVRRAAKLPPAEAMRPERPRHFRSLTAGRPWLQKWLSPASRMIWRRLERHPVKSILSMTGIALAVAVLILGTFPADIVNFIIDFQFQTSQRQDAVVTLTEPASRSALQGLDSSPGILRVEPFRSVPVRLGYRQRSQLLSVTGLERSRELFRLMNEKGGEVSLPPDGLVIGESAGELLGVKPGDFVRMEVMEGHRPVVEVRIAAVWHDFSGTTAWMETGRLNALLKEGPLVSGAFITIDEREKAAVFEELKKMPAIAGITLKSAAIESFRTTLSDNLLRMRVFNILFAAIIAFGVVYNTARIALSERGRELATLRVLGFSRAEVSWMLLGEIGILTLAAIPFGLLLGRGLAALAAAALQTRTQRFPLVISPATFGFAVLVVLTASIVSALAVRRRLDHLDLVEVLKSRE